MALIALQGHAALSDFRLSSLLDRLKARLPDGDIASLEATYVYFLDVSDSLSDDTLTKAHALLGTADACVATAGVFVTPRKGTISPWSSKATDIFKNCGLEGVIRVERGLSIRVVTAPGESMSCEGLRPAADLLYDRMTEGLYASVDDFFQHPEPAPMVEIDVLGQGHAALEQANVGLGLALSDEEIDYLYTSYVAIRRNPTDVELVMFGQVNSEHCRHKIFNADWIVDGERQPLSLFGMIRNTHEQHPGNTLVAYKDNSGVICGVEADWFQVQRVGSQDYGYVRDQIDMIMKVETHNHPTAISPFPGAATGVGGEIRDETATGVGGKSKAGLSAFMVSNLRVPGYALPWEQDFAPFPTRLATPFEIMLEGPIGGANFGNEFGRPQLCGLFKTYEQRYNGRYRGYHKPIMVAGGMGNIRRMHVEKQAIRKDAWIVQLGGPAMRIGLGGGAASSMDTGSNAAELDFDSVQRGNAEMERRCQEVVDACIALGRDNPIVSIHDIGAGGLSNGCPELVSEVGGRFWLRKINNEDRSMSPMEIWCCEAQERYVLAIMPDELDRFLALCERERCPVAVVGQATGDMQLTLEDAHFGNKPIDIDIRVILGRTPKMLREACHCGDSHAPLALDGVSVADAVSRVLRLPAVANKTFLITITDRSITGMVARDQMTGPYQTPVADAAVTVTAHTGYAGEVMAMGERTNVALVSGPASGRLAIGEALTNLAGTDIATLEHVKLSANWMCACGEEGEDMALFDTVKAVGMDLCPQLGIAIPVGKDSLSMRTLWEPEPGKPEKMTAPLSLVISAFATVDDARLTVTPDLKPGASELLLIDLGAGRNRLGASALAQVYNQVGDECPDLDDAARLVRFFRAMRRLVRERLLLAYHDRSDGGLFVTLAEMAFAGRRGLQVALDGVGDDDLSALFAEELGGVIQVAAGDVAAVHAVFAEEGLTSLVHAIGVPVQEPTLTVTRGGDTVYSEDIGALNRMWSELTYRMQAARDNPDCAAQEYDALLDASDPGMQAALTYEVDVPYVGGTSRPRMAILREQGINGQVEMAAAFDRAGFACVDVHMTDLLSGRVGLSEFAGLVACGGFSYGDVLGAGAGWAKSVLFNARLKADFAAFFARPETFALGVCNGCQMMSQLKSIIPGAEHWPTFTRNRSEQFEARFVTVEVLPSPSILLTDMAGSRVGIPVAHGEGYANFVETGSREGAEQAGTLAVRYVDNSGQATERYPLNPNGSPGGIAGLTTRDGRVTIMMPHPERAFRSVQLSYRPPDCCTGEAGPWLRMFQNARRFVG